MTLLCRFSPWGPVAVFSLVLVACGGSTEAEKDEKDEQEKRACDYNGQSYADGETFPRGDGCNDCECHDGEASCSFALCPDDGGDGGISGGGGGCFYLGQRYYRGDTLPQNDECNVCTCQSDGSISCTKIGCADVSCTQSDRTYELGASFPETDGCNVCSCSDTGVYCTLADCAAPQDDACSLPFDGGDCDGAIPAYWHNPETGQCEVVIYGGCGGNDNRYQTLGDCQGSCGVAVEGKSCLVGEITYPHGASNVPDPSSCNSCSCSDGAVTGCTEINCPTACPEGTQLGTDCAECGPGDGCLSLRTACLQECSTNDECTTGQCFEGLCRSYCG